MRFSEPRIASTNYLDPEDVYALVVRDLCGEKYHRPFRQQDKRHIADFLKLASEQGFTFERFNELLLLLEQDRVSEAFYTFFFSSSGQFPLNELADKVIRFRGFAMLCYGNFRFAYKDLSRKTKDELLGALKPFCQLSRDCDRRLAARPAGALRLESIPADQTWAVGKITKMKYDKEAKVLAELLKADPRNRELGKLSRLYERLGQELEETRGKALRNTDVYLTWDYMDIYVATSMRKRW